MSNKTKIIICILIVLAIVILIFGVISNQNKHDTNDNQDEFSKVFDDYVNDENKVENDIENWEMSNNVIENNIETNTQLTENNIANTDKINNIVGKEEQESSKDNTESDNKKLAIELAKKEWAISVDSYDFQVSEVKSDGTYDVSVINSTDRNIITIYNVNVQSGTVTE